MSAAEPADRLVTLSVGELLDATAARTTAPGGGAAAALTAALAASLTAMAARFDRDPQRAAELTALADDARARAAALADADVAAYSRYVAARRSRSADLEQALDEAIAVPLQVSVLAEQVAGAALRLAREGNPRLRGDAATACWLAAAAAGSASGLVAENLPSRPGDERIEQARACAKRAHDCALASR